MQARRRIRARFDTVADHTRAYLGLCAASVGWAAAFLLGKVALAELSPLSAAAWRYGLAALVLLPFAWRGRRAGNVRAVWRPLVIMAVCGGTLYPWLFFSALQRTSATNASLLVALNPALTCLLAPLIGEAWTPSGLLGVGLALVGAAMVITHGDPAVFSALSVAHAGDLLAIAAAALWAVFNLAARRVVVHVPHARINAIVYGIGGAALFGLAGREHPWQQLSRASPAALAALVGMAVLSSVLAGQLFLYGVHRIGVSRTVVFIYLVPMLTAAAATLLLGESLLPAQVVGGAAVLSGVWVASRSAAARERVPLRRQVGVEVGDPIG